MKNGPSRSLLCLIFDCRRLVVEAVVLPAHSFFLFPLTTTTSPAAFDEVLNSGNTAKLAIVPPYP